MNRKQTNFAGIFALWCAALSLHAQNLTGTISCEGKGVANVAVSDGIEVTVTDSAGHYQLQSKKANGYVFYSLPNGYEPVAVGEGCVPNFWSLLSDDNPAKLETHDFELRPIKNEQYRLIIGADAHLANQNNDVNQFCQKFIPALVREKESAQNLPVYSIILGDLTWDVNWYQNDFQLTNFVELLRKERYPVTLFPVIGNHDNDPATQAKNYAQTDFLSSSPWRLFVAPNYYSFNLGRVHFVVIDNVYYKNEPQKGAKFNKGVKGTRSYAPYITPEQMRWIVKDLQLIHDPATPIVFCMHIPAWSLSKTGEVFGKMLDRCSERLAEATQGFQQVHIISGHMHVNYHAHPEAFPHLMEHNIVSMAGDWWQNGYYHNHDIAIDGTPSGYFLWNINRNKIKWDFKRFDLKHDDVCRLYDINEVRRFWQEYPHILPYMKNAKAPDNYALWDDNYVVINAFAYDDDWKIEAREGKTKLQVEQFYGIDPYYTWLAEGSANERTPKRQRVKLHHTRHLFRVKCQTANLPVTVKIVDSFGKVSKHAIQRPHPFCMDMEEKQIRRK